METTGKPSHYPRRILLAVAGLTPQIVTETVYALAEEGGPSAVPTEVQLVTTSEGAERARLTLLGDDPGWFGALCHEHGLPDIEFSEENIHVLRDKHGGALDDIRNLRDNECAADAITKWIRRFTLDEQSALHVSIAGGRKTMGFYAGYALSLFGREQDRLSHVLVSPPDLESHPLFFYPSRTRRVIHSRDATQRPLDTLQATVVLSYLPFVKLRHGLPDALLTGDASFTEAVDAVARSLGQPHLVLDRVSQKLHAKGGEVYLPRAHFVFYYWLTGRVLRDKPLVQCPPDGSPDSELGEEFLGVYEALYGETGVRESTREFIQREGGMTKEYFTMVKSKINQAIRNTLDGCVDPEPYCLQGMGDHTHTVFGPGLRKECVNIPGGGA